MAYRSAQLNADNRFWIRTKVSRSTLLVLVARSESIPKLRSRTAGPRQFLHPNPKARTGPFESFGKTHKLGYLTYFASPKEPNRIL